MKPMKFTEDMVRNECMNAVNVIMNWDRAAQVDYCKMMEANWRKEGDTDRADQMALDIRRGEQTKGE